jgi:hypothetical protein
MDASMNAMTNLLRKEYRDAREVLIGGIAIFWVLPIILELLLLAIGRDREAYPFVWMLVATVGWLYAVVIGAHTVCRDWGKAEEHFLLAMPVSARQVIWAKLKAGAVILFLVLFLAATWDFSMARWGAFGGNWSIIDALTTVHVTLLWTWVFVVGYVIGFTAAVVTRQMLAGTLAGCLALLIWLVGPLISSHLQFLRPNWWSAVASVKSSTDSSWLGFGWPFVMLTVLGLVTCVGTALICCTRERVIRLGHKQLAWMMALIVLALLGLALGEVGNSLVVRDQKEIFNRKIYWDPISVASLGDQFYAVSISPDVSSPKRGPENEIWRLQLASFQLDEHGLIKDLRQTSLPDKYTGWAEINGLTVDENGEVVMTLNYDTYGGSGVASLLRLRLWWPNHGPLEVTSRSAIKRPGNWNNISPVNRNWVNTASRYAYFQTYISEDPGYVPSGENTLYVYDWLEGPNPQPLYEIQLPPHTYARMYRGGELWIGQSNLSSNGAPSWIPNRQLDPDHPELLLDKRNLVPDQDTLLQRELFLDEPNDRWADKRGDLWCVSNLSGLRIFRHPRPHKWEFVGEYRPSPLALWFRRYGHHQPRFLDESLVLENGQSQLTLYNVSDPAHPRRVGYFQTYYGNGQVYPTSHFLLVVEENLLTVLDRPTR